MRNLCLFLGTAKHENRSRRPLRNPISCFDQAVILSSMTVLMRPAAALLPVLVTLKTMFWLGY
jgi:hypothetical protein